MTAPDGGRAPTVAALVRGRADDDNVGLLYRDHSWTWREVVAEAATRASWLRETLDGDRPPHVGVLLPNVPEYVFLMFGAALAGACVVGINPTRRGAELERDIEHTCCQLVIWPTRRTPTSSSVRCASKMRHGPTHRGAALPDTDPPATTLMCLLFTSGSTSAPKAAMCSQARMARGHRFRLRPR